MVVSIYTTRKGGTKVVETPKLTTKLGAEDCTTRVWKEGVIKMDEEIVVEEGGMKREGYKSTNANEARGSGWESSVEYTKWTKD